MNTNTTNEPRMKPKGRRSGNLELIVSELNAVESVTGIADYAR